MMYTLNQLIRLPYDDKRLQDFDKIATYSYGTNAFKVCETEMLSKYK